MKKIFLLGFFLWLQIANTQITDFNKINFTKADNIAALNKGENLKSLSLLSYKLTSKLPTNVEKFRAIYSWVCNNIKGDFYQNNTVSNKRKKLKNNNIAYLKWNETYKKKVFKKLLKHKKTMCTGYAYLIKELALLANIECKIVDGYGRTVTSNINSLETANHSWNAVKLNNKWYLCDATWSSGYTNENNVFVNNYNDGYFLTNPILFAKNHYPLNKKWLLSSTISSNDFVNAPLIYGEAFKHKINTISPSKMKLNIAINTVIDFKFSTNNKIQSSKISLIYFTQNTLNKFEIYSLKNSNGIISFKNKFKKKGTFDVHLKIENDIVATYTITVHKKEY